MTDYQIKREVLSLLRKNSVPFSTQNGLSVMGLPVRFIDEQVLVYYPASRFLNSISFPYEKTTILRKFLGYHTSGASKAKTVLDKSEIPVAPCYEVEVSKPFNNAERFHESILGRTYRGGA